MLYLWRRMGEEDRGRLWRLYGWFSGLMACGSCFGAVSWAARMMFLVNDYKAHDSHSTDQFQHTSSSSSHSAVALSWLPAWYVTYAIEFMCMCAAQLMVLDRMMVFAAPQDAGMQKRWAAAGRVVMAAVVLGNAVGLAANAAAAVHFQKAAAAQSTASIYYAVNNAADGYEFDLLSDRERQRAGSIASVQRFAEVAVLLLIVVAFVAVGCLFMRRFRASLTILDEAARRASVGRDVRQQMSDAAATSRALQLQMLGTTAFIFVSFLLRSVFSTMLAVALRLRDFDKECPGVTSDCDPSCHNEYTHIWSWMNYTPEFQLMVILISSPVAQLVALWGMTTKSTLQLMMTSKRSNAILNGHEASSTPETEMFGK
jgi:hypothetical protein